LTPQNDSETKNASLLNGELRADRLPEKSDFEVSTDQKVIHAEITQNSLIDLPARE
jgi:hypothetical protein